MMADLRTKVIRLLDEPVLEPAKVTHLLPLPSPHHLLRLHLYSDIQLLMTYASVYVCIWCS